MSDYWLGLMTTPAIFAATSLLVAAYFRAQDALAKRGITWAARWKRDIGSVSDYILRHDIWWERSFGPVFVGGWYREYRGHFTRWIGVGSPEGPNVMIFRKDVE